MIGQLKEDSRSKALLQMTKDDIELGRMTALRMHEVDLDNITLSPRFCIEQGTRAITARAVAFAFCFCWPAQKADGSAKLRPIDDFSRSGCNATVDAGEKLRIPSCRLYAKAAHT